jgi:hypothetical protein
MKTFVVAHHELRFQLRMVSMATPTTMSRRRGAEEAGSSPGDLRGMKA